jgi:drug/metabolite transporter (DMT)-like permease
MIVVARGRLPPALIGIAWMIAGCAAYALCYATIRELTASFSVFQITFFRAAIGMLVMLPWLMRVGLGGLRTGRQRLYGLRAVITYTGMVCWFYGLAHMGLADATALMFTAPFFTVIFLSLVIGERVGLGRWAAIATGFVGALVIVRPGFAEVGLATLALIYVAVSYGVTNAFTRMLAMTEPTNAVVFYMFALVLPLSLVPAALTWTMPLAGDVPMILAFGILSVAAMQCWTRALAAAPGSIVMPISYLQLPFVGLVAFAFYGEVPGWHIWLGGAIIVASSYTVARAEARRARDQRAAQPATGA